MSTQIKTSLGPARPSAADAPGRSRFPREYVGRSPGEDTGTEYQRCTRYLHRVPLP